MLIQSEPLGKFTITPSKAELRNALPTCSCFINKLYFLTQKLNVLLQYGGELQPDLHFMGIYDKQANKGSLFFHLPGSIFLYEQYTM